MSLDYPEYEEPEGLAKIRMRMTHVERIKEFNDAFGRDPSDEDELDEFIEIITLEIYNAQLDQNLD